MERRGDLCLVSRMMLENPQSLDWKDRHSKDLPIPSETCRPFPCAQALTDDPCVEETTSQEAGILDQADARAPGCHTHPEEQRVGLSPARLDELSELCLLGESCTAGPGVPATPGKCP